MSFKILYVTATSLEAAILKDSTDKIYSHGATDTEIKSLVTGVGSAATSWSLLEWVRKFGKPDLAINTGIAGSFNDDIEMGDVVMPVSDCFADSGIENDDKFITLFESGLQDANEPPFIDGMLYADPKYVDSLRGLVKPVRAITVNTATGSEITRMKLMNKFNPDIETMEGATFFYICARENIPFLALRAVSNKIEKRNRNSWNIDLALSNLSEKLIEVLLTLS